MPHTLTVTDENGIPALQMQIRAVNLEMAVPAIIAALAKIPLEKSRKPRADKGAKRAAILERATA